MQNSRRPVFLPAVLVGGILWAAGAATPPPASARPVAPTAPPKNSKPKPKQRPGGANQVTGMTGKIGDMLFDGRWRFQVQKLEWVNGTYTLKVPSSQQDYARFHDVAEEDLEKHAFTPKAGYTLLAIQCLAKNGQKTTQQLDFYSPNIKTALADDQGVSYQPIVYDMMSEGAWTTKKMLPGSAQPFTILFAVPPGTKLKDLVFTLKNWADNKTTDLRISLAGAPTARPPPPPPPPPPRRRKRADIMAAW